MVSNVKFVYLISMGKQYRYNMSSSLYSLLSSINFEQISEKQL